MVGIDSKFMSFREAAGKVGKKFIGTKNWDKCHGTERNMLNQNKGLKKYGDKEKGLIKDISMILILEWPGNKMAIVIRKVARFV